MLWLQTFNFGDWAFLCKHLSETSINEYQLSWCHCLPTDYSRSTTDWSAIWPEILVNCDLHAINPLKGPASPPILYSVLVGHGHYEPRISAFLTVDSSAAVAHIPEIFLPLDLLLEYWTEYITIRRCYVTLAFSTRVFYTEFAPTVFGAMHQPLASSMLVHFWRPSFKQPVLCRFDTAERVFNCFCFYLYIYLHMSWYPVLHYHVFIPYFHASILYFCQVHLYPLFIRCNLDFSTETSSDLRIAK